MELEPDNPAARELLAAFALLMKKIEQRPRLAAALADPRNSNEAFYSMMFGDVEALLDRVAAIDKSLNEAVADADKTVTDATGRMNLQTSQLLDAGSRYEKLLNALVEESKRSIIKAAEAAKQAQLRDLEAAMTAAAGAALQAAINDRVGDSLALIDKASKALATSVKNVNSATGDVKASAKRWLFIAPVGGLVAVLIFFIGQWYVGRGAVAQPMPLTQEQQRLIEIGGGFDRAWPTLDATTQAKLQAALRKEGTKAK